MTKTQIFVQDDQFAIDLRRKKSRRKLKKRGVISFKKECLSAKVKDKTGQDTDIPITEPETDIPSTRHTSQKARIYQRQLQKPQGCRRTKTPNLFAS